jgi:GMP synthase - Glutamine amidotransferase domain
MKQIRIHFLQHVPFEGPGYIAIWASQNNYPVSYTKLYEEAALPELNAFDWLVVMGGPMGVYDESIYPWLTSEKLFIRKAIESQKVVLGICLGSQLIAEVLGAKVYPNKKKEIGWFPILLTAEARRNNLFNSFPEEFTVMHWHGDTFDLPLGAKHLIQTEICPNQAFIYRNKVIGLQFHFEFIPESLEKIVENCKAELIPDDFIQSEKEILENKALCETTNKLLAELLNHLAAI